jgi:hypothetical protein
MSCIYEQLTNGNSVLVTYHRDKDILRTRFADTLALPARLLAKLIGFPVANLRFNRHGEPGAFCRRRTCRAVFDPAIWN